MATAESVLRQLEREGDAQVRSEMATRYGIHTDRAFGVGMARMKAIAKQLAPDHDLALTLWQTGVYEARTIAAHVDDPSQVDVAQMDSWCFEFDNWAIVDTACFALFDKAPDAWSRLTPWAASDAEFTKRASFALLWALALHDKTAADRQFVEALPLIEANAHDPRDLVGKAQTMALRAIALKRPGVRAEVESLVARLSQSDDAAPRRVVRPIGKLVAERGLN